MTSRPDNTQLARALFSEFFALLFLVYFGCGSVAGAVQSEGAVDAIDYAMAFGFTITALAYAIGDISGGHINPAVTLAMAWTGNLDVVSACAYVVAQFGGACCGGGLLRASVGLPQYNSGIFLTPKITAGQGLFMEFMGTLVLIFVIFNVAVWSAKPAKNDLTGSSISAIAPIPIGLTVLVAHQVLGPFTGCGINPARVLGSVIWSPASFWDAPAGLHLWIYFVGPFLASIAGPLFYYALYGTFTPGTMASSKTKHDHTHPHKKFDDALIPGAIVTTQASSV